MPAEADLKQALSDTFDLWQKIVDFIEGLRPDARGAWNFAGTKFGWSFRIYDRKKVLLYLLPRDKFFRAAFVFGQKAVDSIRETDISGNLKAEIDSAKVYAEGRGIWIPVHDESLLEDVKKMIRVKILN